MQNGAPLIGLNDSGGARIQEGVVSLGGYADIFYRNTLASGVIPQLSAIMGPCAGGAVYSPAITDFILMVEKTSYMFVTGPNVVKTVTHEEVSSEDLGGASVHSTKSGVSHFSCENEVACIQDIKRLLSYMPQNCEEQPPALAYESGNEVREVLKTIVPENANQPYDIREVIEGVIDEGSFHEVHKHFAENIVVGFARLGGRSIGVVANQPAYLAGVLIYMPQQKQPVLYVSVIASISRCWYLKMCRASCRVPTRSGMPLLPMEPSCFMLSARLLVPAYYGYYP